MPNEFPVRLNELTTTWLSNALGYSVASFQHTDIGAGKGMLGDIFRLDLELSDGSQQQLVAKFSADREETRAAAKRAGIFKREIDFYEQIAPVLKCRIPRCFGTWYEAETAEFLILMECIDADFSVNQIEGVSYERAVLVMKELAALHVPDLQVAEFRHLFSLVSAPERRANQTLFVTRGWEEIKKLMSPSLSTGLTADEMVKKLLEAFDHLSTMPFYLLHGDARPDNLLFERSETSVALVDWQGVALGPREWDIGYFLAQGLRVEDRRAWTDDLLDVYVSEYARYGEPPNRSEMARHIGKAAWFSFGVACSLFTVADTSSQKTIDLAASMGERALSLLGDSGELP
jgi:aminoglycoside phosphotransferase (APT) family kinase protein